MHSNVKFHHVEVMKNDRRVGYMTAATRVIRDCDTPHTEVSFAFWHRGKDKATFSKKQGNMNALYRLITKSEVYVSDFSGHSENEVVDVFNNQFPFDRKPNVFKRGKMVNTPQTKLAFVPIA